ncbi:MAG TPA: TetR/AcrR family transcriptional regulator [Solirubrobacteraceae bacterium]|nr:TetR/AcrR family transcriptional regulator [Solirubrobacteraceae bacterium]
MSGSIDRPPARRADAQRNHEKILAAARAAFADTGTPVSMAEISRRAGVGMATLYRNFPSRQELLEALFTDDVNAVCAAAATPGGDTPGAALTAWLHRFFAFYNSKRHVGSELLKQHDDTDQFLDQGRSRVLAAGRPLLLAAQRSHEVRDDLILEQVLDMFIAIAKIDGDTAYLQPILQSALDGLQASNTSQPT